MADDMLAETLRDRLPRLFAAGADHNDIQTVLRTIRHIDEWPGAWAHLAEAREAMGVAALAAGHTVSAGAAFQKAALYYHFGQFVQFNDLALKQDLQRRQAAAHGKAAPHLLPPSRRIEIPFEAIRFAGNLRLPAGEGPAPCVMLNPGADSTKEEFHTLENEFLARGLATFSYDGPGQGLTWSNMRLRPDYEAPIGAVLSRLREEPAIDPDRIGIWGRSFGAYCALRGATDPRMRACVSIGGFYDLAAAWPRMPKGTTDSLGFAFGATPGAEAAAQTSPYTLDGVLGNVGCPVLVVHSGQDNVCPVEDSDRMVRDIGPRAELRVFAEGNHVCDNIPYKVRPLMADWLADALTS
jgi:2,6-dihydroxypseudooxynicotine hydrolase